MEKRDFHDLADDTWNAVPVAFFGFAVALLGMLWFGCAVLVPWAVLGDISITTALLIGIPSLALVTLGIFAIRVWVLAIMALDDYKARLKATP